MHVRFFLFLLFYFSVESNKLFAQELEAVSLEIAPSFTRSAEYIGEIENPFAIAYGAGIHTWLKITNHFSLKTGIQYRVKAIELSMPDLTNLVDPSGNINYDNIGSIDSRSEYNYLGINFTGRYVFSKSPSPKAPFYLSLGLECSNLFWSKYKIEFAEGTQHYSDQPEGVSINTSLSFSAGILFKLSERIKLFVEPGYAYDFYAKDFYYEHDYIRFQSIQLTCGLSFLLKQKTKPS